MRLECKKSLLMRWIGSTVRRQSVLIRWIGQNVGREGESVKHYQTGTGLRSERYEAQTRETGTQRQEWILLSHLGKNNVSLMNHNPAINHLLITLPRRQENIVCNMKSHASKKRSGRKKRIPPCKIDASNRHQEFNHCFLSETVH